MQIFKGFIKLILLNTVLVVLFRIAETVLVVYNFDYQQSLAKYEITGLLLDIIYTNSILFILYPAYYLLWKVSSHAANYTFLGLVIIFSIAHLFILNYFLYQLIPLDIFLFHYTYEEIAFTLGTTDISYGLIITSLIGLIAVIIFAHRGIQKLPLSKTHAKIAITSLVASVLLAAVFSFSEVISLNNFSRNKPLYFYSRSITYLYNKNIADRYGFLKEEKLKQAFQNNEYPLLREFDNNNVLKPYFDDFEKPPNIVFLIIEGLNDDFIHKYNGNILMPFLNSLKTKSLYWNKCFSPGERSFAAVPSIIGSLPHGVRGLSMLDIIPTHLSLVNVLNANNYYTSFFYGQGSWFHSKDRFFEINNIDLIVDNSNFSQEYERIIVGNNNFFWGYNDKDLFSQSFSVIDTIDQQCRLDIYFTGSSHSPFVIPNNKYYSERIENIIRNSDSNSDKRFFNNYRKYIKSILLVDDALSGFFEKYKSRSDYENTVFIITGDHPMTELPIKNSLKRYHVPLIIYSPKLKEVKTFNNVVSHWDIYETLLAFLSDNGVIVPKHSSALGKKLIPNNNSNSAEIFFMSDNREIIDFYYNDYYLSGENLYKVDTNLNISEYQNKEITLKLNSKLESLKNTDLYVSLFNRLIPDSLYCKYLGYKLLYSEKQDEALNSFSSKYHDLFQVDNITANKDLHYKISFNHLGGIDGSFSLVYQLVNQNDSVVYWANQGISNSNNSFQANIILPAKKITDTNLIFESFFWNKNKEEFNYRNTSILLYQ